MRKRIESKCHTNLRKLLSESIFVGCIDREMFLVQYETNLYLCNVRHLSEELFYQLLLYDFENFARIRFAEPLSIVKLAEMALNTEESGWCDDDGPIAELSQRVSQILCEKAAILKEYYGISISADGHLESLPMLLGKCCILPNSLILTICLLQISICLQWLVCRCTFCAWPPRSIGSMRKTASTRSHARRQLFMRTSRKRPAMAIGNGRWSTFCTAT